MREIGHVIQCNLWGGVNNYAFNWWLNLGFETMSEVVTGDLHGPVMNTIHAAMPFERPVERCARAMCADLNGRACRPL
jgi:hypothetical protein